MLYNVVLVSAISQHASGPSLLNLLPPPTPCHPSVCCAVLSRSVMSDSATQWAVAHQAPLSMGILQARILEWVAMPSSRRSSPPRV